MKGRDIGLVLLGIALVVLLIGSLAGGMMGPGMMGGYWGYGYNSWMGLGMLLFWVLLLGGGALLLVSLLRGGREPDTGLGPPRSSALDILRERYARGELTREEYEQMRREIE